MLQYLNLKTTKFEVGQRVEVKTKEGVRYGVVRSDQGNNYYHVEYEGNKSDIKVSARHMKVHNPIDGGDSTSSFRSASSTSSSPLRSMYNRIAGGISSVAPLSTNASDDDSVAISSKNESSKNRSSFASRKRNSIKEGNTMAEVDNVDEQSTPVEETSIKKKKPLKRRVLTNIEIQVLDRIRQSNAKLESSNGNVFSSKLDLSYLQLHEIPEKCHEMRYLREIVVRKNEFKRFSDIIRPFPNIVKIDAAFNMFNPPPEPEGPSTSPEEYDPVPFQGLNSLDLKLSYLDLSGCNLTTLPTELMQQAPYLEVLIIRKNLLTELPEWLSQFNFLYKLDCADNMIQLSPGLCKLLEEDLIKLSDINFDRNPCLESFEKDLKGEQCENENGSLVGPKTRFLLQKVSSCIDCMIYFGINPNISCSFCL